MIDDFRIEISKSVCHSGFISESNCFNKSATLYIPKQVWDDSYGTACNLTGASY